MHGGPCGWQHLAALYRPAQSSRARARQQRRAAVAAGLPSGKHFRRPGTARPARARSGSKRDRQHISASMDRGHCPKA
eukprot:700482-Pyramimonas_sp.AAC.1